MKKHSMPNLKTRSFLLFSVLTLGAAFAAQARGIPPSYAAPAASGNRYVVATLLSRPQPSSAQAAFMRADTNRDGKLSPREAEHFPAMSPHFQLIDTNHDKFLSFDELVLAATDKPADSPTIRQAIRSYSSSMQAASFSPAAGARVARAESAP